MAPSLRICVVGGNGFVGSAVCRAAITRGWRVTALSRQGKPFTSPNGHQPAWTERVEWNSVDADDPNALLNSPLVDCDAAVHTIGILLESDYKSGSLMQVISGLNLNPYQWIKSDLSNQLGRYERVNRDSALNVLQAFTSNPSAAARRPFIYLSAEDVFRPIVSSRYIDSKRAAEIAIGNLTSSGSMSIRPVFVRPSLIYHPHLRPISTIPATVIDLSATIQRHLPVALKLRTIADALTLQVAGSVARLFSIPPLHVDAVAEAICVSVERSEIEGVVDVPRMRQLVGFGP